VARALRPISPLLGPPGAVKAACTVTTGGEGDTQVMLCALSLPTDTPQDWVGHKNIQNTTKYTQLTNPRRDEEARKLFADHRVV
jgi:integrase